MSSRLGCIWLPRFEDPLSMFRKPPSALRTLGPDDDGVDGVARMEGTVINWVVGQSLLLLFAAKTGLQSGETEAGMPVDDITMSKVMRLQFLLQECRHRVALPIVIECLTGRASAAAIFVLYLPFRWYASQEPMGGKDSWVVHPVMRHRGSRATREA